MGMRCLRCEKGTLRRAMCTFEVQLRGEDVRVREAGLRCDICGWETQDLEQAAKLSGRLLRECRQTRK